MIPTSIDAPIAFDGTTKTLSRPAAGIVQFSPRERQVVKFIVNGCSNQEIADCLGLRLQTVKNHLSRIYRKLGVPNRVQLAVCVVHDRMVEMEP